MRVHCTADRVRRGAALVAFWLALCACDAYATSCNTQWYTRDESERMYADATEVFVGVLERTERPASRPSTPGESEEDANGLTRIDVTGSRVVRIGTVGTFRVTRHYKGNPSSPMRVLISSDLQRGRSYLVYANSSTDGLYAFSDCWRSAVPIGSGIAAYLDHLDHLPADGGR